MTSWRETDRGHVDPRNAAVRLSPENAARVERVRWSRLFDEWIVKGGWRLMPFAEYVRASG